MCINNHRDDHEQCVVVLQLVSPYRLLLIIRVYLLCEQCQEGNQFCCAVAVLYTIATAWPMVVALVLPLRGSDAVFNVTILLHSIAIAWFRCSVQCHYCHIALPLLGSDAVFNVTTVAWRCHCLAQMHSF